MKVRPAAVAIVLLLVSLRVGCEYSMMAAHGPDAQMGIWFMLMLLQSAFWLTTGVLLAGLLPAVWSKRRSWHLVAFTLCLAWMTAASWSSARFYYGRQALVDASASASSPERLRELVDFNGIQAGYELDNRIALNPKTPPDVLRVLYARPKQVGTDMCIAQNPNTPDDILLELADRDDDWSRHISDALKRNPKYSELLSERE